MDEIERQLKEARRRLLDLTLRNRLLNFRPSKTGTLEIVDEVPAEIYDILVLQEKNMDFLPKPGAKGEREIAEEASQEGLTVREAEELWSVTMAPESLEDRHSDRFLQTKLESHILQRRLFLIHQKAESILEEQGYSILYLALGFLEWFESPDAQQARNAPLILVPVDLRRKGAGYSFRAQWTGEDISTNISLQAKLSDQTIKLPDFAMGDSKETVNEYIRAVEESISSQPKWRIVPGIFLGFFSFTKFLMYKDLDPQAWPQEESPADHPLVREILDPSSTATQAEDEGFQEDQVDERLKSRDVFHVTDADPSQVAVIQDVKNGRNLVVEGPPGTGKSQTITNIIAELVGAGKSVLFVSEKMAALEVVKSRLDLAGLGDFCLELHSRKAKKAMLLKELERALGTDPPRSLEPVQDYEEVDALKLELNAYAQALRKPLGKTGRSPYNLFAIRERASKHFAKRGMDSVLVRFEEVENWSLEQWAEALRGLQNLADSLHAVQPVAHHPWYGCYPNSILPADESEVRRRVDELRKQLQELLACLRELVAETGIRMPQKAGEVPRAKELSALLKRLPPTGRQILTSPEWNSNGEAARVLTEKIRQFHSIRQEVRLKFDPVILETEIGSILQEYERLSAQLLRFFSRRYRFLKREIRLLYKANARPIFLRPSTVITDLEKLVRCRAMREDIRENRATGKGLFGDLWKGEDSDSVVLAAFIEQVLEFRSAWKEGWLTELSFDVAQAGVSREKLDALLPAVSEAVKQVKESLEALLSKVNGRIRDVFASDLPEVLFEVLNEKLRVWAESISLIHKWAHFVAIRRAAAATVANPLIPFIDQGVVHSDDVLPAFELNATDSLLAMAFREHPALGLFSGDFHERRIERFRDLDRKLISMNQKRLINRLHQSRPKLYAGASKGSEAGILLGELNRKRGHMPIRKLMTLAGGLIQKIKPCFMMSPLSVAQFLDPRAAKFDAVVFDEASQVRPEDALGTLLRGNQAAVVGDTKQLPPTSFFDQVVEVDEPEEEEQVFASIVDTESILHQCKRCFPSKLLRWHYRSRHETLIAVSNQEFYENRLLFYPSPVSTANELGLYFVHLPGTIYDRGRSAVNREEAREVAKAAVQHYRNFPDKSLGVGTFSLRQQLAILEEIELQLRHHPEMEEFLASTRPEHFFVKNLETIQGDERDVIFLSVGYGFDASRQLSLNFGPLNHEGGWRRLNVLITRAREKCVVFSNFRAVDLHLGENSTLGLRALKTFLQFAETRSLQSTVVPGPDSESPFEDSVCEFLQDHGFEVRRQVGCAGFRVDLGIVDPRVAGRYLIGIECDGVKYHTSSVARDRDRLRQQILENLGWRIVRVWSTDWYRNRAGAQERLLASTKQALESPARSVMAAENASKEEDSAQSGLSAPSEEVAGSFLTDENLESEIPAYELCALNPPLLGELHETSIGILVRLVEEVVDVEGPVHIEEVLRRIRTAFDLKRTGERIRKHLLRTCDVAAGQGKVRRVGEFLWPVQERPVPLRRRNDDPPANIDLICDEEITQALKLVLRKQFSTFKDDLVVRAGRGLGIRAIREGAAKRIQGVIDHLIQQGVLTTTSSGMIDMADREQTTL